jgi:hypothetical protein
VQKIFRIAGVLMSAATLLASSLHSSWGEDTVLALEAQSHSSPSKKDLSDPPMTVDDAVRIALEKNPNLISFKKTWIGTKDLEKTALAPAILKIFCTFYS